MVVKFVTARLHLVIHIERAHHAQVHVDQLGGEVEVALDVAGIKHVDDHVGGVVNDLLADIKLFGTVGRKRVGAGEVDKMEAVALEVSIAVLGVDRHARVVAHPLVGTRGKVEERRLSAVRVAHKGHVDGAAAVHGYGAQLLVGDGLAVLGSGAAFLQPNLPGAAALGLVRLLTGLHPLGLLHGNNLDHLGLVMAERHLVAHQLVFHRVAERGVEQHFDDLALDKSHLDNALSETAMAQDLDDDTALTCFQF